MKADYVDQEAETTKRAWLHTIVTSTSLSHLQVMEPLLFELRTTCKVDTRTIVGTSNPKRTLKKDCDQIFEAT